MDLIGAYGSSDEEAITRPPTTLKKFKIDSAPDVLVDDTDYRGGANNVYLDPSEKQIAVNLPYNILTRQLLGPEDPRGSRKGQQNIITGQVEQHQMSEYDFRKQEYSFISQGFAQDPSLGIPGEMGAGLANTGYVGDIQHIIESGTSDYDRKCFKNNQHLKRKKKGDPSVLDGENAYLGPWAGYENDTKGQLSGPTPEEIEKREA
ncbi:hypothetical protein EV182_003953, partial [Spiromyces aspiralis]